MNPSLKVPTALGFILAMLLFALSAHAAPAQEAAEKRAHYEVADFAEAKAHAPPQATAVWTRMLRRTSSENQHGIRLL